MLPSSPGPTVGPPRATVLLEVAPIVAPTRHDAVVETPVVADLEAIARVLGSDLDAAPALARALDDDTVHHVAEALRDELRRRALESGDHDAVIASGFDAAFGGDGLGSLPWIEGNLIVCPGAMIAKGKSSHRSRFVSVNDCWIWESGELIREDKRSSPGKEDGFRAIALLGVVDGLELDVVTGKQRGGQYSMEKVVSLEVRGGRLVETSTRVVKNDRPRRS